MSLIIIGTNYKYCPLGIREKFFFFPQGSLGAPLCLRREKIVKGAVILSTCERIEFYTETDNLPALKAFFLKERAGVLDWGKYIYLKADKEAVVHLFKVAAGLDSQIIGENEILHQVKTAYIRAREFETTTPLLNRVFERALFTAKFIREKTGISKRDPSVAQAAVDLAQKLSLDFAQKKIYIIGAGTVARGLVRLCREKKAKCIIVANRTFEKARDLAREADARAIRFAEFYDLLSDVDILFSATASRHLILKKEFFEQKRKTGKEMLIFDLAFPRDIDPAIAGITGITLFDLDDFSDERLKRDRVVAQALKLALEKSEKFFQKEAEIWNLESEAAPVLLL